MENTPAVVDEAQIEKHIEYFFGIDADIAGQHIRHLLAEYKRLKEELLDMREALDESDMPVGNDHHTYTQVQRIQNLAQAKDYFVRQTDKARTEVLDLKSQSESWRIVAQKFEEELGYARLDSEIMACGHYGIHEMTDLDSGKKHCEQCQDKKKFEEEVTRLKMKLVEIRFDPEIEVLKSQNEQLKSCCEMFVRARPMTPEERASIHDFVMSHYTTPPQINARD